jgi:sugar/nucleoside kinase (ribokinase family)
VGPEDRPGGVLCLGNMVLDILVHPASGLRWNTTEWVDSIDLHLGGNGANTAYTLAKLGVPAWLMSACGRDPFGDTVVETLLGAGVDLSLVERLSAPTAATVALVNAAGDRSFFHRPGASGEAFAGPFGLPDPVPAGVRYFHLANVFALPRLRSRAAGVLRSAREAGLATSLDTGWDALGEWMAALADCLSLTDLLFVNREEARMLTGEGDPARAARRLLDRGAGSVVVKLGGDGCLTARRAGSFQTPAYPATVVDTTGAGDCFAGGYLAAMARGWDEAAAARLANAAGACCVRRLGAVTGILYYEETIDEFRPVS